MKKLLHTKAVINKDNIADAQSGIIRNVIGSTAVIDRMGDIIDQSGWRLKNFKNAPRILYGHDSRERLPIGKALKVWIEDKGKKTAKLMFDIQFDLQDSFAAEVFRKIKDGYLNTVSVGFQPFEWEELDPDNWFGGLKFVDQDLLELSVVPIPANPEALIPLKEFSATDKRFAPMTEKDAFPQTEDNRFKKMMVQSKEVTAEKVKEVKDSEFVTTLRDIEDFDAESFRALPMKKDDKDYVIIVGKLAETDAYVEQSHRFSKDAWSEEEVAELAKEAEDVETEEETVDEPETGSESEDKDLEVSETKEEEAEPEMTDDSDFKEMTASQLEGMMNEVWKDGYEAGDEADDEADDEDKGMKPPADDTKVKSMKVGEAKALMDRCFSDKKPTEGKANDDENETIKEARSMVTQIEKAGRVLSAKNENKVRQAVELLSSVLSALDKQEEEEDPEKDADEATLKTFAYKDLGTAPDSESFDAPGEVAKADLKDLENMSAYRSGDAEDKSSFKLIHHKADGKAVWRGVAASMGALMGAKGANIPEEARKEAYEHLAEHYKEFGKTVPEYSLIEKQVLAGLDEEVHALILDREDKHAVRLLKKILDNQKAEKKSTKVVPSVKLSKESAIKNATPEQIESALRIINLAFEKMNS